MGNFRHVGASVRNIYFKKLSETTPPFDRTKERDGNEMGTLFVI